MQNNIDKISIFMSLLLLIYLNTILHIVFLLNKHLLLSSASCQIAQLSQILTKNCEDSHINAVCRLFELVWSEKRMTKLASEISGFILMNKLGTADLSKTANFAAL